MVCIAKNKTEQMQQIMFVDNSCISVKSNDSVEIDLDKIFKEELVRIKMFFEIKNVVFEKTKRTTKYGGKR